MLVFMGIVCEPCDGAGYTSAPVLRNDSYGQEYDDYTCVWCGGTGTP